MRKQANDTYTWTIREMREEAPLVRSFLLEANGERPSFISGQYLTVMLDGFLPAEGKSFSISSNADDTLIRLTVKKIGAFSGALYDHAVGDTLTTSAPYGFFYPDDTEERDLVFVAGGIGITPCMSIINSLCKKGYSKNIFLFYSNRTPEDVTFLEEFTALNTAHERLTIVHHITREETSGDEWVNGRMSGASIVAKLPEPKDSDFFLCGSIDFTKNLWKELREAGIQSSQLYTEGFF